MTKLLVVGQIFLGFSQYATGCYNGPGLLQLLHKVEVKFILLKRAWTSDTVLTHLWAGIDMNAPSLKTNSHDTSSHYTRKIAKSYTQLRYLWIRSTKGHGTVRFMVLWYHPYLDNNQQLSHWSVNQEGFHVWYWKPS